MQFVFTTSLIKFVLIYNRVGAGAGAGAALSRNNGRLSCFKMFYPEPETCKNDAAQLQTVYMYS
jgi:hypothetical protein